MSVLDGLVDNLLIAADQPAPFAVGTVVSSVANPDPTRPPTVTVRWQGINVTAACPQHYTPTVDDVVVMARFGPQLNIIGAY